MPTYDYQCRSCGHTVEVIHSMTEEGPTTCERCGGSLRRVLYPTGIIFKGSGFYKTDSRASGSGSTNQKPASTSEPGKKSDSPDSGSAKPDVSSPSSTTTSAKAKDGTP
ncbi:MAG TPA: FmdB family zinc ribbon protein [Candidatus Limnocylindria bacterium]|nr:FmdB family zinc ribbon protein [Candidatus Limnocylindria bacterium]